MIKIIVATNNRHKLTEIRRILHNVTLLSLSDAGIDIEVVEDGQTFDENSLIKARAICEISGLCAIADDSGLVVPALGGAPGVYSARYAGIGATDSDNNAKLLREMNDLMGQQRAAYYHCSATVYWPDGRHVTTTGRVDGFIATEYQGDGGFGYDPLFYVPMYQRTMAQITPQEKDAISHRSKAFEALRTYVSD